MSIRILLLLALIGLSACGSQQLLPPDQPFPNEEGKGVAVLSFTESGLKDAPFYLLYRGTDPDNRSVSGRIQLVGPDDWEPGKGRTIAKGRYAGRVIPLHLLPGEYAFYRLGIAGMFRGNRWEGHNTIEQKFTVIGDKISYVANFHLLSDISAGDDRISYNFAINNEQERDMAKFYEKYPNINSNDFAAAATGNGNQPQDGYSTDIPENYQKLLAIMPVDAEAHKNRAGLYIRLKEFKRAIFHADKALELDATLAEAHSYRSVLYLWEQDIDSALESSEQALTLDANNSLNLMVNATVKFANGDENAASDNMKKALAINPNIMEEFPLDDIFEDLMEE